MARKKPTLRQWKIALGSAMVTLKNIEELVRQADYRHSKPNYQINNMIGEFRKDFDNIMTQPIAEKKPVIDAETA